MTLEDPLQDAKSQQLQCWAARQGELKQDDESAAIVSGCVLGLIFALLLVAGVVTVVALAAVSAAGRM